MAKSCNYKDCKKKIDKIAGECKFCEYKYCGVHRLPENHTCEGMEVCKKNAIIKNKIRLMNDKMVNKKITVI